jgi:hypothetical protein
MKEELSAWMLDFAMLSYWHTFGATRWSTSSAHKLYATQVLEFL